MTKQATAGIALGCRALASERDTAAAGGDVPGGEIGAAIEVLGVIAGMAVLAKHGWTHGQQRPDVGAVRRMAVSAVVHDGRVLPQEGAAFFGVAGIAGLVYRFLHQQFGSRGSVRIVAVGAGDLAFDDGMARETMNLGAHVLVTAETDFGLSQLVHHFLIRLMRFVAIRTGQAVGFMRAARPIRSRANAGLMAGEAGGVPGFDGGLLLRTGAEDHVGWVVAGILPMLDTLTVTALAAGGARIALYTVPGLIDGKHRCPPILVVAHGALLVPFKRPIHFGHSGQGPDDTDDKRT